MVTDREIIADYEDHYEGQREVVNWDRLNEYGATITHFNVPVCYLRAVTKADYLARNPGAIIDDGKRYFFWEVSVD